jgi:hypothetical protein
MKCKISECNNEARYKSTCLCQKHYLRFRRHGSFDLIKVKEVQKKCSVTDCDNFRKANGLCTKHYSRQRRLGSTNLKTIKTKKQLLVAEGKSFCPSCNKIKPIDNFYKDSYATLGIAIYCKECSSKKGRLIYSSSKSKRKNYEYRKLYNISLDDYNKMLKDQDEKCLICHKKFGTQSRSIHVDHDHKTKKVRGLLCSKCNPLLGLCDDNVLILEEAIKYIKKYSSQDNP